MGEKSGRALRFGGIGAIALLGIFGYFSNLIPNDYKTSFYFVGAVLAIGLALGPRTVIATKGVVSTYYCSHCENIPEKLFCFTNYEKNIAIDRDGNATVHHLFELLNDGANFLQRFPFQFSTTTGEISKTLQELEDDNEFEIKSADKNCIKWKAIEDGKNVKHISVVFDQKVKPGEVRKYSIRYDLKKLFNTTGEPEWVSFVPIHFYKKMKLTVVFNKNYKIANVRYCVESPGKDSMYSKCGQLEALRDGNDNKFVEIVETYPRINFEYRVEWDLPK